MTTETATIITNHQPRNLLYGYELTAKEREDFDYIDEDEFDTHAFFRYRGICYDFDDLERSNVKGWDGQHTDSFFSAVLVKVVNDDQVICGLYLS